MSQYTWARRVGRRIVKISGPFALADVDALALYGEVRATVWPGNPVRVKGYVVSVQRAVRGPRVRP